jgi:hypothetical protein
MKLLLTWDGLCFFLGAADGFFVRAQQMTVRLPGIYAIRPAATLRRTEGPETVFNPPVMDICAADLCLRGPTRWTTPRPHDCSTGCRSFVPFTWVRLQGGGWITSRAPLLLYRVRFN